MKSPVDYFPQEFEIDPNDAYYESDYIALLPFVEDEVLESAYTSIDLTKIEEKIRDRNFEGPSIQYCFNKKVEKIRIQPFLPDLCRPFDITYVKEG